MSRQIELKLRSVAMDVASPPDGASQTKGTAQRARARARRSQARHVLWLQSTWQTLATHHTAGSGNLWVPASRPAVTTSSALAALQAEVAELRGLVSTLQAGIAAGRSYVADTEEETKGNVDQNPSAAVTANSTIRKAMIGGSQGEEINNEVDVQMEDNTTSVQLKISDPHGCATLYSIVKCAPLQKLVDQYLKDFELRADQVRFMVAGERIGPADTANKLKLADNDTIDVVTSITGAGAAAAPAPGQFTGPGEDHDPRHEGDTALREAQHTEGREGQDLLRDHSCVVSTPAEQAHSLAQQRLQLQIQMLQLQHNYFQAPS